MISTGLTSLTTAVIMYHCLRSSALRYLLELSHQCLPDCLDIVSDLLTATILFICPHHCQLMEVDHPLYLVQQSETLYLTTYVIYYYLWIVSSDF